MLFENKKAFSPLADRLRPTSLEDYEGQAHIVGVDKPLRTLIKNGDVSSLILWGPPGVGKTTLAHIIASNTKSRFVSMSAVDGTVGDLRRIIKDAQEQRDFYQKRTILFLDEIHRFNKSQQDALLPAVESGTLTLIGATTENPSFEVNSALLSRARVVILNRLDDNALADILKRAISNETHGLGMQHLKVPDDSLKLLIQLGDGDARRTLGTLELAASLLPQNEHVLTVEHIKNTTSKNHLFYDKSGEEHYNIISALHKSMRGGDANAALYWLGRMLEAGEDPLYLTRRLIRFASEDIGLADPQALVQAVSAHSAAHAIGMPECNVVLAQCVTYLSNAPKSNALYAGYSKVQNDIETLPNEPVPLHLRNAPTKLMKNTGYGKGYKYTPDFKTKEEASQDYLPEKLKDRKYL
jgi:putative ATPase